MGEGIDYPIWENERAAFLANSRLSLSSRNLYDHSLRKFEQWCSTLGYDPLRVGPPQLFEYRRHLHKIHKQSTVSHEIATVKMFFKFLVNRGALERNPAADITWDAPGFSAREVPDVSQLLTIWRACDDDDERSVVGLLGLCGLRPKELEDALVRDLGHADGIALLRIPARRDRFQSPFVPLCEPLADVTDRLRRARSSGPLVRTRWETKVSRQSLRRLTRRLGERSGLDYELNPLHLSYCLRSIGIERGFGFAAVVRSLGEVESRRLSAWVPQIPESIEDHLALRLGRLVLGSGSESAHNLHMASELLRATEAHPAAATAYAGATVERHLRKLMLERDCPLPNSPKLSAYGAALRQREVIDNRALQLLNRMQELRNAAAHGRFEDISGVDATWFIDNAGTFFAKYPLRTDGGTV